MTQLTVALPPLHRTPRKSCNFLFSLHFATINLYWFVRNICLKTNNNTFEKNFEKCLSIHVFYYVFALNKLRRNTGENSSLFYIGNQSQISCSILSFNELFFYSVSVEPRCTGGSTAPDNYFELAIERIAAGWPWLFSCNLLKLPV